MAESATDQRFWDERYRESDRIWSGRPNAALVREITGLAPGRALDLGCGEGADAIWLAEHGWQVTAVDITEVALGRAAEHARTQGVADRVTFQRHTLGETFPAGTFDLISACYLHSRGDMPREEILRTAVAAVAPGGTLLVVSHAGFPHWEAGPDHEHVRFPTPEETLAALELAEGAWEVLRCAEHTTEQRRPDGQPDVRTDSTVKIRRLTA
ncbi:class I SAM-dependent methyltransferase [Streptomyces sp. NBC_01190]|uniref:class I SAM-dependent methyltransferase n=1 Tax=Streptomyces sp. NBC_01190 TaxID=2903767 RepID=UPI00386C839D|nr:class I SAM-dependent methyltransferase [Streptomyces sp. NBC_01190]